MLGEIIILDFVTDNKYYFIGNIPAPFALAQFGNGERCASELETHSDLSERGLRALRCVCLVGKLTVRPLNPHVVNGIRRNSAGGRNEELAVQG